MRLLFASDFDGTLFFHDGTGYRDEDLKAIRDFQKDGNLFGICTGRSLFAILEELEKEPALRPDFILAASGSVFTDGTGQVLQAEYIPYDVLQLFYNLCGGLHMYVPKDDRYLSLSDCRLPFQKDKPQKENARIEDFENDRIDTFSFEGLTLPELEEWKEKALQYKDRVSVLINEPSSVDFTAPGCNKGTGLVKAAAHFKIPKEHTGCMGDSLNDLDMLAAAAHSFTFPGTLPAVQASADNVCASICEALQEMKKHFGNERGYD